MYEQRDPTKAGRFAVIATAAWITLTAIDAASSVYTISVLNQFSGGVTPDVMRQARLSDAINLPTSALSGIAFCIAGFAILRWILVTNRNAHGFAQDSGDQMTVSPRWSIGWFFIPFANFYMPFKGVSETWRATINPRDIAAVEVPWALRLWWGLWIVTNFWGNLTFRAWRHTDTTDQLMAAHSLTALNLLIDLPLAIVLIGIIRKLTAMQHAALHTGAFPAPSADGQVPASFDTPIAEHDLPN
ncbi:hypothetical protein DC429_03300 [Arthrobacter sp. TPD3018]|uniref:DUF4328 domain-containing protein n=1 Tax=Bacteria TaxID=2 RepID=UPI000D51E4B2|nr:MULTISPECIES: DUF4328 domain-containing protein [Bacteria]PVE59442.1 hypothetical protein DC425_03295 [Sphingomonas sp. TPD3009]PVE60962.1 hypothetical protein DC429_03300 [Arthrobacter sp. TPD3018]PVE87642.1 hypothetical protein DC431_03295 [Sphingomonas melonis]